MKKVVIIHGMSAPLDECFGLKAKERFKNHGYEIYEPIFPLEKDINYDVWNSIIDKCVSDIDEDTCFLCHSLGCIYVVRYLFRKKAKVRAVIAVAGGFFEKKDAWKGYDLRFIPSKREFKYFRENVKDIYHICSDNDDIFTAKHFKDYINLTKAKEIMIKNCGHFGRRSGVKDIKEIETILQEIDNG